MLKGQRFGFIIQPTNIHTGEKGETEEVYYCLSCGEKLNCGKYLDIKGDENAKI
jgi:hypothetical protein